MSTASGAQTRGGRTRRALVWFGAVAGVVFASAVRRMIPADTEYEIWPDPIRGTVFRMSQIESAARQVWRETGEPPVSMASLLEAVPNASGYEIDRWSGGMVLSIETRYVVVVSPGQDGIVGSHDDLVQVSTQDSTWLGVGSIEAALRHRIDPPPVRETTPR